ncbi:hypothetical protein GcM1_108003, partial [Golovinomyces cichoracearum]
MWDKEEEHGGLPAKDYQDFMNLLEDHEPSSPLGIENAETEHDLDLPRLLDQPDSEINTSHDIRTSSPDTENMLRDRWYVNTPFMSTPSGVHGIRAHSKFLQKHDHEMSSPSRDRSHSKFHKGAEIIAIQCGVAHDKLREAGIDTLWASKSNFINEDNLNKHVTP